MATQIELESIMVRMYADASRYLTDMNKAAEVTKNVADKIQHEASRIEGFKTSVEGFAGTLTQSLGAVGLGVGIWKSFEKFEEAEKNMRKLSAAVEVNGGNVAKVTAEYKKFAAEMTAVTSSSKSEVLSIVKKIETYGLSGEAAKRAAQDTLYLAAATDHDAQALAQAVAMYEQGNVHMLQRMLHMHNIGDATEVQIKLSKLLAQGQAAALAEAESASAKIEKAQQKLSATAKEVGAVAARFIIPVVDKIGEAAEAFNRMESAQRDALVKTLAIVGGLALLPAAITKIQWALGGLTVAYNAVATAAGRAALAQAAANNAGLLKAGIGIGAAIAISYAALELTGYNKEMKEAEEHLQRVTKATDQWLQTQRDISSLQTQKIETITDPAKKQAAFNAEIKRTSNELKDANSYLEAQNAELDRMKSGGKGALAWMHHLNPVADDPLKEQKGYIEDAKKKVAEAEKQANKAKEAFEKFLHPKASPELELEVQKLTKSLKDEIATVGMDADAKRLYEYTSKHVASALTDELSATMRILAARKEEIEAAKEVTKDMEARIASRSEFIKSLSKERDEYGKSAEELKKMKAIELGFGKDKGLSTKINDMIHNNEIMKEATDLTKKYISPVQQLSDEYNRLNELMSKGLDPEIYGKAIEDAKKRFDEASGSAEKTRTEIQKLNGVLAGSAEAKFAISQSIDQNKTGISPGENKIAGILTDIRSILSKGQQAGSIKYVGEYGGGGDFGDADLGGI